jgi:hypothetical protein
MLLRTAIHGNYHRIGGNNKNNVYPLPITPFLVYKYKTLIHGKLNTVVSQN